MLMQRPSVIASPSGRVPARAPRWDLADIEGCDGGNSFLWCSRMFLGYVDIYRRRKYVGGAMRGPRGWGAHRAPSWPPRLQLDVHSKSPGLCLFRKDRSRRFHFVWTSFDIPFLRNLKIGKNNNNLCWASGIRLVPKMIKKCKRKPINIQNK